MKVEIQPWSPFRSSVNGDTGRGAGQVKEMDDNKARISVMQAKGTNYIWPEKN